MASWAVMKQLLAAVSLVCLVGAAPQACHSTSDPDRGSPDTARIWIVGDWSLAKVCGGIAGRCSTTDTLSSPTRYVFRQDGNADAYRGSTKLFTTNYMIGDPAPND